MLVRERREEKGAKGRVGKGSDQVWEEIDASAVDVKRLTNKVIIVSRTLCALPAFSQIRIDAFSHVHQYVFVFTMQHVLSMCRNVRVWSEIFRHFSALMITIR